MTKPEIKKVVTDLRNGVTYDNISTEPLFGIGLSDFPKRKYVRKEVITNFLNYQCMNIDGSIDEPELENCLFYLKDKKVVMI